MFWPVLNGIEWTINGLGVLAPAIDGVAVIRGPCQPRQMILLRNAILDKEKCNFNLA